MHLREALIEAATGNDWHNCSWNGHTGRFCQENGPSTCATSSGSRTSELYFAGPDALETPARGLLFFLQDMTGLPCIEVAGDLGEPV